jgi:ABC-type multidrug transport system ATPase subunit
LLDVLAQRKTEGELSGKIHVDGRVLPLAFQRSAGYCEQQDVHEPLATVREALEFSAILRQPKETPREEKIAYVDTIVELLGMKDIEHALVGQPGNGLNVEQRKRLTIGVELVAKPSILLFLDEPTSGLDSQSAFSIVKFLRKLADAGQAGASCLPPRCSFLTCCLPVLVTIHQPSASLFYEFDNLLLLARGGKTVYNGPIGHEAESVKSYFAEKGAPCPDSANPAEHMIDVVSGHLAKQCDWNQTWLNSDANKSLMKELEDIEEGALSRPVAYDEQGEEFAASLWEQCKVVCHRNSVSLFRDTEYVTNKFALHIFAALFNGFTFWMIGDGASDLQLQVFTIFSFIFV